MKTYKTEGVIIKRINYGEADKILTIFTKHHGKITVMAKGIRKITSRKKGSLELFNNCTLFLAKGKNFDLVTETEIINNFLSRAVSFEKLGRIYYFCEVIDRLTAERVEELNVYQILIEFLESCKNFNIAEIEKRMNEDLKKVLLRLGFIDESRMKHNFDIEMFIENLIEGKIKSKKIINV